MVLLLLALLQSQVTTHDEVVHEDAYFDVDTATTLSRAKAGSVTADFVFTRREEKLAIVPLGSAVIALRKHSELSEFAETLELADAGADPVVVAEPVGVVGRTSEGKAFKMVARPSWMVVNGRGSIHFGGSNPFIAVELAVQHDGTASFGARPGGLKGRFTGESAQLSWAGDATARYRVMWERADGKRTAASQEVAGTSAEIKGLDAGHVYRIRVARLAKNGEGEPAAISLLAAVAGVERRVVTFQRPSGHEYRINLREGTIDEDADWIPYFWGMKTPAGGGIRFLGTGEAAFAAATELPEGGYAPRFDRFDDDWVYAIRLRDGRFAKVWVRPTHDVRDSLTLEIVLLKGGGRTILAGPRDVKATWDGKKVKLSWKAVAEKAEYIVSRIEEGGRVVVAKCAAPSVDIAAEANAFLAYSVTAVIDGMETDASDRVEVTTFPSEFKIGRFRIAVHGESFHFDRMEAAKDEEGDLVITSSAGGASSLEIKGRHGIASGVPGGFGLLAGDSRAAKDGMKAGEIETDDRRPATMSFALATSEGGFAHLRIIPSRTSFHDGVTFEYVYRPRPSLATIQKELSARAKEPTAAEAAEIEKLLGSLDSDDVAERDAVQGKLVAKGAVAISAVTKAHEKTSSAEVKARLEAVLRKLWEQPK